MTRVIILAGSDEFIARVNVHPGTQVVTLPRETIESERFDLMRSLDPEHLPDLVFCCDIGLDTSLVLASTADELFPTIDFVLVGEQSPEWAIAAMRAGVRDIVPWDMSDAELTQLLRRADLRTSAAKSPPAVAVSTAVTGEPRDARVVAVISPKGGVGKTSIATNLTIGIAEKHPMDVVLVDLDLQFGDVASVLDLAPEATMEDALSPAAAADTLVLKTMLTVHPAGFHVLCGSDSPAANEHVAAPQIHRLLAQLASQFSHVVIDTAAGLDEPTLAALELSDSAILVSTMDVSCVRGMRKELELLGHLGLLPETRTLALNLADRQSGMKVKDVEAVVGMPVDVVIPRAPEVQLAANQGKPLMLSKKAGPFTRAVWALMERVDNAPPVRKHRRLEVA
jgi:pilus assembly protein CpaE